MVTGFWRSSLRLGFWIVLLPAALALLGPNEAAATFHLMQIERVIGGVGGDTSAQAIQLRMRSPLQHEMQEARLVAWDATGSNPVILIDYGVPVPNDGTGVRVLAATAAFSNVTDPACVPDFTLTNPIPASYLAAGSLTFEDDSGIRILWRLSWGGAAYTGPTTGEPITNDNDGEFGPPWPDPLPSSDDRALRFTGAASAKSTNNAADYALTVGAAVFTNNVPESFTVVNAVSAPGAVLLAPALALERAAPNPFNPLTTIGFTVPEAGRVVLTVHDVTGTLVATLADGAWDAGRHSVSWSGTDTMGRPAASGVYVVRLETAHGARAEKVVLTR